MNSPLISVIVPVYNTEKYLDQCIQSVLAQTYTNWELLLIDDGSTDSSGAICNKYAAQDNRIRVFHKENGGVSSARNLGLDNAQGEWITFCDSDDVVLADWLKNYDVVANEKYDLITQGFETVRPVFDIPEPKQEQYVYALKYEGSVAGAIEKLEESKTLGFLWIKLFKSNVINNKNIRFNESLTHGEDAVFIYQYLSETNTIMAKYVVGYHYRPPLWHLKYKRDFSWEVIIGEALYQYCLKIMKGDSKNKMVAHFREDLTSKYIHEFRMNPNNRRLCVQKLRAILKRDFFESQMFILTKIAIIIDPTYVISTMVLRLHLSLKK